MKKKQKCQLLAITIIFFSCVLSIVLLLTYPMFSAFLLFSGSGHSSRVNSVASFSWPKATLVQTELRLSNYSHLGERQFRENDLLLISSLPGLRLLEIEGYVLTPKILKSFSRCQYLESLHLGYCEFDPLWLKSFNTCGSLVNVSLHAPANNKCVIYNLRNLKSIRTLSITGAYISPQDINGLWSLSNLEKLTLDKCEFESLSTQIMFESYVKNSPNLTTLIMRDTCDLIDSLPSFVSSNYLKVIAMIDNDIKDCDLFSFTTLGRNMESIYIESSSITDKGLFNLTDKGFLNQALRNRVQLKLANTLISDEGIRFFQNKFPSMVVQKQHGSGNTYVAVVVQDGSD